MQAVLTLTSPLRGQFLWKSITMAKFLQSNTTRSLRGEKMEMEVRIINNILYFRYTNSI